MKNEKPKIKNVIGVATLLALAVLVIAGCEGDNPIRTPPSPPWLIRTVRIIAADTLRYVPGDSASMPVTAVVLSLDGRVMPGRRVAVGLENAALGFLELVNPSRGDTTDDLGRLQLIFTATSQPGLERIFAVCEGVSAMDSILILEYQTAPDSCIFHLEPDSIRYLYSDSAWVTVRFRVIDGIGLPNVQIHFSVTGGILYPPPATDPPGCATFLWQLPHQTGWYYITIPVEPTFTDSVWVEP